ncbi:MAG: DinB family protein [Chitinispirillales bacterium]|jgi:hypothetical protein|nr:DinB family protein [Chitinispirillales bacterium]
MFRAAVDWNPKQQKLREELSGKGNFDEAVKICFSLHGIVHTSPVSSAKSHTYMDEIWDGLSREMFSEPLTQKNNLGRKATIAWDIWHITRIEDITTNILIANSNQVLNPTWLKRLGVKVKETGNAMSDNEIARFSRSIDMEALREYRNDVGLRTREIINNLTPQDLKRKFKPESLKRIVDEGGVVEDEKSIWLIDFWGRKNVAGIILMPVTRHQLVHLNECMRIKNKLSK